MIVQPWHYDKCTKVTLSASMLRCASKFKLLLVSDCGVIDTVAELATQQLPGVCFEGPRWDGAMWIEFLGDVSKDSLAHWLTKLAADDDLIPVRNLEDEVGKVLVRWLSANCRDLRSLDLSEELT